MSLELTSFRYWESPEKSNHTHPRFPPEMITTVDMMVAVCLGDVRAL